MRISELICVAALLQLLPIAVQAQDTRHVDPSGSDVGSCTDEGNPCATIGYALNQSNPSDIIDIAAGEYTEALEIEQSINLVGAGVDQTFVQSAASAGAATDSVMEISGENVDLTDLTVRFGHGGDLGGGGVIYAGGGILEITNVRLSNNAGGAIGGGAVVVTSGISIFEGVDFTNNATNGDGGGLLFLGGQAELRDVSFSGNVAEFRGGGAFFHGNDSVNLQDVAFVGNQAGKGGAIALQLDSVQAVNLEAFENSAVQDGGAIWVKDSDIELVNAVVGGNTAGGNGGGLHNSGGGLQELLNVTFGGNDAGNDGGGIYNVGGATASMTNTMFWGNEADRDGGEIYNSGTSASEAFYSLYADQPGDVQQGGGFTCSGCLVGESPLFVDPAGNDFRLQIGSPARDAGDPFTSGTFLENEHSDPVDLDGNPRFVPDERSIDIGPYELQVLADDIFRDRFEQ